MSNGIYMDNRFQPPVVRQVSRNGINLADDPQDLANLPTATLEALIEKAQAELDRRGSKPGVRNSGKGHGHFTDSKTGEANGPNMIGASHGSGTSSLVKNAEKRAAEIMKQFPHMRSDL